MRESRAGRRAAAALLFLGLPAAEAAAAVIASVGATVLPGGSTGTIGPVGATPAPNNDDAGAANPNVVPYTVFYNAPGTVDVEFNLAASGGTTEYRITQTLINNTGAAWTGFHYELGFGTGADFVRSTAGDGLDFDVPGGDPAPASSAFAAFALGSDTLDWSGGTVPSVGALLQGLAIDVPDGLSAFDPAGRNRFTLRQVPTAGSTAVPEPGSLAVLGAALGALLAGRRRSRGR